MRTGKLLMRPMRTLAVTSLSLVIASGPATADEPRLEPGQDPGGLAIAVVTDGVDYTNSALSSRLARDGEGEAIAWDFADGDARPYRSDGVDDRWVVALAGEKKARIVVVRVGASDSLALPKALAFIGRTPARDVYVPTWILLRADRTALERARQHFPDLRLLPLDCPPSGEPGESGDGPPGPGESLDPPTAPCPAPAP